LKEIKIFEIKQKIHICLLEACTDREEGIGGVQCISRIRHSIIEYA